MSGKLEIDSNGEASLTITPMSIQHIADLYGINRRTMSKWLAPFAAEVGKPSGRLYTTAQVKIIIQKLGMPSETIRG